MSLLTIVQKAAKRTTLFDSPTSVYNNNVDAVAQASELLFEVGEELMQEADWQFQVREQTFNTVASQAAYDLSTIVTDDDFDCIVGNTAFDRTNDHALLVVDYARFQNMKSTIGSSAGVYKSIVLYGDSINVYPTPSSVDTYVFYYKSKYWIKDTGGSRIADFDDDADTFLFNEHLLYLGLVYKLRQAYGLPYEDEFLAFQSRTSAELEKNIIKQTVAPTNLPLVSANIPDTGYGQ